MKPVIVIPSYWSKGIGKSDDVIYDHPTDLDDPEETISKTILSLNNIIGNFDVLVIGIPTRPSIGTEMDYKILTILNEINKQHNLFYFGHKSFLELKNFLDSKLQNFSDLVSNRGYGNVRNLCLLVPHILGYDVVVLIDDDEIISDELYFKKATEFIGKKLDNNILGLVVGFYKNPNGSIFLDEENNPWWELVWNKKHLMNEGFKIVSQQEGRLVDTPFAFGGNMVVIRDVWIKVPFDPLIKRGEDMDFLRNVKKDKFSVKLDKELFIEHHPPKGKKTYSLKFQEDIFRFLYAQAKNESLNIDSLEYMPYPGYFLKNTSGKVLITELLYYIFYNKDNLIKINSSEALIEEFRKIDFTHKDGLKFAITNKDKYRVFQQKWQHFLQTSIANMGKDLLSKEIIIEP